MKLKCLRGIDIIKRNEIQCQSGCIYICRSQRNVTLVLDPSVKPGDKRYPLAQQSFMQVSSVFLLTLYNLYSFFPLIHDIHKSVVNSPYEMKRVSAAYLLFCMWDFGYVSPPTLDILARDRLNNYFFKCK